jgi:glc operon protein GlcG
MSGPPARVENTTQRNSRSLTPVRQKPADRVRDDTSHPQLVTNSEDGDGVRAGKSGMQFDSIAAMSKPLALLLALFVAVPTLSTDLPTKKYLDLASIKIMVAAAEAEAKKRNVEVTLCVVDESGNLLFLEKADGASLNTIQFAQKKARHAAFYRSPSREGAETVKKGSVEALAFPDFFPNQGGLPIQVDGRTIGGIAASGAKSEIDEAIAQAGIDALFKK